MEKRKKVPRIFSRKLCLHFVQFYSDIFVLFLCFYDKDQIDYQVLYRWQQRNGPIIHDKGQICQGEQNFSDNSFHVLQD